MQRPDIMDAVSDLASLSRFVLPKAYLPYSLHMCWKQPPSADKHGPQALAAMIERLGKDWKVALQTELQTSLVSAVWKAQSKSIFSFLGIVEQKSGIDHAEWMCILASMAEALAEKVVLYISICICLFVATAL